MIVSTNLSPIPFLSNTDSTRLQMSGKQLPQTVTHINCERAKVIGSDWPKLTEASSMFIEFAENNGSIIYTDEYIMVVLYENKNKVYQKIYEVPEIQHTANNFATTLRYKKQEGFIKKGELLFEYDCFRNKIPCYGYNVNTAYIPCFGFNFEDAYVISERFSKKAKTIKVETLTVPIYKYSLYQSIYPNSKFKFLPEVGQKINGLTVCTQSIPKSRDKKIKMLSDLTKDDFIEIVNDSFQFNFVSMITKIENAEIDSYKVHKYSQNITLLDPNLQNWVELIRKDYVDTCQKAYLNLKSKLGADSAKIVMANYYVDNNPKKTSIHTPTEDLVYIIEIKIKKEESTKIGDKFSNR
jgi:DNA-directed RNA polymerase beta subunit